MRGPPISLTRRRALLEAARNAPIMAESLRSAARQCPNDQQALFVLLVKAADSIDALLELMKAEDGGKTI